MRSDSESHSKSAGDDASRRDLARAAEVVAGQLVQRGVRADAGEDPDALATALESVERFEREVALLGGDSMVNAPDSKEPSEPRFVLPTRKDRESLQAWTTRVSEAADSLGA